MQKVEIKAEKRARVGKSLQTIRHIGILPAVVYGHDFETTPIQVDAKEFEKAYQQAGESSLVYINLDGEAFPQDLPHEIQVNISALKSLNDHLLVKDLKLPSGVELKDKEKMEEIIALVQEPISEAELEKQL